MKHISLIYYCSIFFFSCNVNHKLTTDLKDIEKISFSVDSLDNINYFDFYGQTLEELLDNNIVNQCSGYRSNVFVQGYYGYLVICYTDTSDYRKSRYLNVYFEELKYTNEDTLNSGVFVPAVRLMKEKIRRIDNEPYSIVEGIEQERQFINSLKNINLDDYYGKPIDELISLPIFKKWSWLMFGDTNTDNKLCLNELVFMYNLEEQHVLLSVTPESFKYSDNCIEDTLNKYWNLNDLRKETIKDIKLVF